MLLNTGPPNEPSQLPTFPGARCPLLGCGGLLDCNLHKAKEAQKQAGALKLHSAAAPDRVDLEWR